MEQLTLNARGLRKASEETIRVIHSYAAPSTGAQPGGETVKIEILHKVHLSVSDKTLIALGTAVLICTAIAFWPPSLSTAKPKPVKK